jgi:hypothetical protein
MDNESTGHARRGLFIQFMFRREMVGINVVIAAQGRNDAHEKTLDFTGGY